MKRITILALICTLIGSFVWLGGTPTARAATCNVPTDYGTIQAAVDDTGCDTIEIADGTYTEALVITRTVTLRGESSNVFLDGEDLRRPIYVPYASSAVTLTTLTVINGSASDGAGIRTAGPLVLDTVTMDGNDATNDGGAIYAENDLTIRDSFLSANTADSDGGGVYIDGDAGDPARMIVTGSTLLLNQTALNGGGFYISYAETDISDSSIDSNDAGSGGGIFDFCGDMTLFDVTLGSNDVSGYGGGIYSGCGFADDTLTVWNSTILQNQALRGAGIFRQVGDLFVRNSSFYNNTADDDGGAIYGAAATLRDSSFTFNSSAQGAAVYLAPSTSVTTTATLENNNFAGQTSTSHQAATLYFSPSMVVDVISNRIAGNDTMGIKNWATTFITDTAVLTNTRGILHETERTLTVRHSTIADNGLFGSGSAFLGGGGIRATGPIILGGTLIAGNETTGSGGGMVALHDVTMRNVTISGNKAADDGGGFWFNGDETYTADLRGVTITDNVAGTALVDDGNGGGVYFFGTWSPHNVSIRNSILADNRDLRPADGENPDCTGTFDLAVYTLVGIDTGCGGLTATSNIVGTAAAPVDPLLRMLDDNGGPTLTHRTRNSSPARDAGNCVNLNRDQRGADRPSTPTDCDMGAHEQITCAAPVPLTLEVGMVYGGNASLTWIGDPDHVLFELYHSTEAFPGPTADLLTRTTNDNHLFPTYDLSGADFFLARGGNPCGDMSDVDRVGVFSFDVTPGD